MGKATRPKKKPPGWISPAARSKTSNSPASASFGENQSSNPVKIKSFSSAKIASAEAPSSDSARAPEDCETPLSESTDLGPKVDKASSLSTSLPLPSQKKSIVNQLSGKEANTNPSAKVGDPTNPASPQNLPVSAPANEVVDPVPTGEKEKQDNWLNLFKGSAKPLSRKGTPFTLPSGEACVEIPNSIIEKHQKSWESFIIGQFYSDPPSQSTLHKIVNGIWSRRFPDITVSKLEGFAFLFKITNVQTRNWVLNQRLWNIDGQTMFVASWKPGLVPVKPELSSAPIWLELRNVPLQFFNEDGLERIASLVGDPKCLHPSTANKTNLEVAKVFTIIDPRKPLPEAVNVKFQTGEIRRVLVSSPWMPPICSYCRETGHNVKHCKSAPITCSACHSAKHSIVKCPRAKQKAQPVYRTKPVQKSIPVSDTHVPPANKDDIIGTGVLTSANYALTGPKLAGNSSGVSGWPVSAGTSEVDPDSSDTSSTVSGGVESSEEDKDGGGFTKVVSKRHRKSGRGKGLIKN